MNRQRDQFTQSDPIGLAGGTNLYGFSAGDPINFPDPFGLDCPEIQRDAKGNCPGGLSVAKWEAIKASEKKMSTAGANRVDSLLEGGHIHGKKTLGAFVVGKVYGNEPTEMYISRDLGDAETSGFGLESLGWYTLHESEHIRQLRGKNAGAEAIAYLVNNRDRLEAGANDYANRNCKTKLCKK